VSQFESPDGCLSASGRHNSADSLAMLIAIIGSALGRKESVRRLTDSREPGNDHILDWCAAAPDSIIKLIAVRYLLPRNLIGFQKNHYRSCTFAPISAH
jgi:hypothetical protein